MFSPSVEKMLGYKPEEMVGRSVQELNVMAPASLEKAASDMKRVLAGERIEATVYEYRAKDGMKRFGELSASPLVHDGSVVAAICVSRDITERKEAEEALRESEAQYRRIVETSLEGIWVINEEFRTTFVNKRMADMLGYTSSEEIIGRQVDSFIFEEDWEDFVLRRATRQSGKAEIFERRFRRQDGTTLWSIVSSSPFLDDNGRFVGSFSMFTDITERKLMEEVLRTKEERHQAILQTAMDGICVTDLQGRLLEVNETYCRMSGYDPWELLTLRIYDLTTEADADVAIKIKKAIAQGTDRFESQHRRKDGTCRDVELSVQYQPGEGGRLVCFVRDITERKREEEELRWKTAFLEAEVEAASDGILVVDGQDKIILANRNFLDLWKIPQPIRDGEDNAPLLQYCLNRVTYPDQFAERIRHLYAHPTEKGHDEIELKDGMVLERYSSPVLGKDGEYYARIWRLHDITERKRRSEEREKILLWQQGVNALQQSLLAPAPLAEKLKSVTDGIVRLFDADFSRIWLIQHGDLCAEDCVHTEAKEGSPSCPRSGECLHLLASSGRYTRTDGKFHRRIPFGCYRIGCLAADDDHTFLTNDVLNDPRIHDHEWARGLGLLSFVGYQLRAPGGKTLGVLSLFAKHPISPSEDAILDGLSSATALVVQRDSTEKSLFQTLESLHEAVQATIQVLVATVEARDPYTAGHQIRVADLACAIATEMGLPQEKVNGIRMAGSIHDIGKLSIPAEILSKPTKLTNTEFALIKEHAQKGYEMLKDVKSQWQLAQIVHQHHERMDGTGYPRNLKGAEIIIEARILAVADVVESMASHRPYRPALGIDRALEEIEKNSGTLYDAAVSDACLRLFREKGFQLMRT